MKLKILILLLTIFFLIGCHQRVNKVEESPNSEDTKLQANGDSSDNMDWLSAVNENNIDKLQQLYDSSAIVVLSSDSILDDSKRIAQYYAHKNSKISSIESLLSLEANSKRQINYEIIKYNNYNKEFIQVLVWKLEKGKKMREFEFTQLSNSDSINVDKEEIEESRRKWIKLCNENNADKLIHQLYSHNTIYYNHKPIIQGTEDLIKEYAYMNGEDYNLTLHPIFSKVVNSNYVFEVGQCEGSYNGKYIIIWKKDVEGNWKVFIDSNI